MKNKITGEEMIEMFHLCKVPEVLDLHPLAVNAVLHWLLGAWTDAEMVAATSMVNSDYTTWAECLVDLANGVGI